MAVQVREFGKDVSEIEYCPCCNIPIVKPYFIKWN